MIVSPLRRILTIAAREYRAMVATKAFLIGVALMPLLMLSGLIIPTLLSKVQTAKDRRILVVDGTGELLQPLAAAAEQRNRRLKQVEPEDQSQEKKPSGQEQLRKSFSPEESDRYLVESAGAALTDKLRLELSDRVRSNEIYAFVEMPAGVLEGRPGKKITFYAEDAALSGVRRWLQGVVNEVARAQRLQTAGIDAQVVARAVAPVEIEPMGLYQRSATGDILPAEKPDMMLTLFLPMGVMMLMFMVILMSAQPMLESVLEEKSQRIAEVMLGCVSAQEMLVGKLLGNVGGSLSVFALYAGGGAALAAWKGWGNYVPYQVLPYFLVYQVLAVLLFSSVFMALGAAVSQLKEAQGLLLPVWILMCSPMFVWFNVVREPNSPMAVGMSFFPPSAPMMMVVRLATGASIPAWQIVGSVLVMVAATAVIIVAASRIYQIGILWQGKSPSVLQLLKWVVIDPTR